MAKNIVSQPPIQVPITDLSGNISKAWSIWFRDLYRRVAYKGGNAIDENKKITDQAIDGINLDVSEIDDKLLLANATIAEVIIAVNENETEITANKADIDNHIALESAHGSNGNVVGFNDIATDAVVGLVKRMQIVADAVDATSSSVVVSSPNATAAPAAYDQAQVQTIVTLANETKADVNTLASDLNTVVTEVNAIVTKLNSLIANSKTAGQMNNV
jgi:hypothetical protein